MADKKKMLCTLGQYDIPIVQKQPVFQVDLLDKHIAVFGAPMSGKTNFLKLLIQVLHMKYDNQTEQIFILDFGGALASCREMPLVSACFDNSNEEYVKRAFKILEEIMNHNTRTLDGTGFSSYQNPEKPLIHTTFMIDNLNAFQAEPRYAAYQEKFAKICRDGLSKGVTVVFTASDTKGVTSYLNNFGQKIALEMPAEKYQEIFNEKVSEIGVIPGRGFANVTVRPDGIEGTFRMNAPYELQCFRCAEGEDEPKFKASLDKKFNTEQKRARKYLTFSGDLTFDEYQSLKQKPESPKPKKCPVTVGLDYIDFCPVTVDVSESRVIGIYGKKEFGKSNLLRVILNQLFEKKPDARFVFFDDGRNQLEEFYQMCQKRNIKDYYIFSRTIKAPLPVSIKCTSEETEKFANSTKTDDSQPEQTPQTEQNPMLPDTDGFNPEFLEQAKQTFAETQDSIFPQQEDTGSKPKPKRLSPFQQFYHFLNEYYLDLSGNEADRFNPTRIPSAVASYIYGDADAYKMPVYQETEHKPTVFVLQSKMLYLSANGEKQFINSVLPQLSAIADEKDFIFLFTDIQKISDMESNNFFNNALSSVFLLDNVAEFAGERGQKTIFGSMDVKNLKEEFARCETGDGYYYDIEADRLIKLKFLKIEPPAKDAPKKDANWLNTEKINQMLDFSAKKQA